jgi:hypothetical protein
MPHGAGLQLPKGSLNMKRKPKMDFTKIDFAKFDVAKMFDVDGAIAQMEDANGKAISLITDKKAKSIAETVSAASFEFARAQAAAAKAFGEAVKKAIQI